jgi:hypothetical protein
MRDEPRSPTRHQLDHAVPTVIHHPEENMPILRRWVEHAMENRTRFWGAIGGVVALVIGLVVLVNGLELGHSASSEAWSKLEMAKTTTERVELAQDYPGTDAERFALLQAANDYYDQGFRDLPSNRDVALPVLKKAADLFKRVESESPSEAPQTRVAALGLAQTLEARNELDRAITQYEKVVKTWKNSDEAKIAGEKIEALRKPENILFYKELYTYKSPEVTLPPGGRSGITLPPDHPPIDGPLTIPPPPPLTLPPPPGLDAKPEAPKKAEEAPKKAGDFPDDALAPEPAKPGVPKN